MLVFKNAILLMKDTVAFCQEAKRIVELHSLQDVRIEVEVSKRCKAAAGNIKAITAPFLFDSTRYNRYDAKRIREAKIKEILRDCKNFKICVSYDYYMEFGLERSIATLRHELSHLISCKQLGVMDHGINFKRICHELGGSMNSKMAGRTFADAASSQYLKAVKTYKYLYTCPCGVCISRKVRMTAKTKNKCCIKCRTKVIFWKEEKVLA
jgi:predicted SprT family Zn-dependent metalloprotease